MSAQFFAMNSNTDLRVTCGGGAPQGGAPAHLKCFRSNQPSWNDIVQVYGALKNPFEIHYPWFSMGIRAVHGMDLKSKMWGRKKKSWRHFFDVESHQIPIAPLKCGQSASKKSRYKVKIHSGFSCHVNIPQDSSLCRCSVFISMIQNQWEWQITDWQKFLSLTIPHSFRHIKSCSTENTGYKAAVCIKGRSGEGALLGRVLF